jgi:DNA-binding FadR family transcriptional regulator
MGRDKDETTAALFAAGPPRERRPSAAGEVIATIKRMIIDGKLVAHQRIPSEQELALTLGVSRPTIREATRALVALNILESRHGDGTYVTSLEPELLARPIDFLLQVDDETLDALFETREILETGIAGLAGTRASEQDVRLLGRTVDAYTAAIGDVARCIELDLEFHQQLAAVARSPILASMLSTVAMLASKSREKTAHRASVRQQSDKDHRAILEAIARRDPDGARQAMAKHLQSVSRARMTGIGGRDGRDHV